MHQDEKPGYFYFHNLSATVILTIVQIHRSFAMFVVYFFYNKPVQFAAPVHDNAQNEGFLFFLTNHIVRSILLPFFSSIAPVLLCSFAARQFSVLDRVVFQHKYQVRGLSLQLRLLDFQSLISSLESKVVRITVTSPSQETKTKQAHLQCKFLF